jgi:ABC-type antimicrobial peptide transport system permease subunit
VWDAEAVRQIIGGLAVSASVLITVAAIGSVLPAARAARVDIMQALRSE